MNNFGPSLARQRSAACLAFAFTPAVTGACCIILSRMPCYGRRLQAERLLAETGVPTAPIDAAEAVAALD